VLRTIAVSAAVAALLSLAGEPAVAHSPGCPPSSPVPIGQVGHVYATPHGCTSLETRRGTLYEPFRSLVVRHEGRRYVLPFPWPIFTKVVAGTCVGEKQAFLVTWPYVTYSISLCSESGGPVLLNSLGRTNRATGVFRVVTRRGIPLRLARVAVPPDAETRG
jgi:hypothetical protein